MLSEMLTVIDRIIALLERQLREKRYFVDEHMTPLFDDLTLIHNDYRKAFSEMSIFFADCEDRMNSTEADADDGASPASIEWRKKARAYLQERKHALQPVRNKLERLIEVLRDTKYAVKLREAQAFMDSCLRYLRAGGGTRYRTAIEHICSHPRAMSPQHAAAYVRSVVSGLDITWNEVVRDYARLKVATLE